MAKTSSGKKERTAMALADTLSAFAKNETEKASPSVETKSASPDDAAKKSPPISTQTSNVEDLLNSRASSQAKTHSLGNMTTNYGGFLKTQISNLMQSGQPEASLETSGEELRTRIKQWLEILPAQNLNPTQPDRAELVEWFLTYLDSCSKSEFEIFCRQWAHYCAGLGFELWWLLDNLLKNAPLKPHLETAALDYIECYQQIEKIQTDIDLFRIYSIWQQDPDRHDYKSLNQTLFVKLSHHSLIPSPPVEIYFASENVRNTYIKQTLLQAAEQDTVMFLTALNEAL